MYLRSRGIAPPIELPLAKRRTRERLPDTAHPAVKKKGGKKILQAVSVSESSRFGFSRIIDWFFNDEGELLFIVRVNSVFAVQGVDCLTIIG